MFGTKYMTIIYQFLSVVKVKVQQMKVLAGLLCLGSQESLGVEMKYICVPS